MYIRARMAEATRQVHTFDPIWYRPSGEEPHAVICERVTVEFYPSVSMHRS